MLLFDVGVEGRVGEILLTAATAERSSFIIIFTPPLMLCLLTAIRTLTIALLITILVLIRVKAILLIIRVDLLRLLQSLLHFY